MTWESAIAYFDGACLPRNPGGTATYGWVLYANENGQPGELISQGHGVVCKGPGASNNRGEYGGVTAAMNAALDAGVSNLVVRGDSDLIISQLQGRFQVRSENLAGPYRAAMDLARQFRQVQFQWIPRDLNSRADRLSEVAYEELTGKPVAQGKPAPRRSAAPSPAGKQPGGDSAGGAGWKDQPATEKQIGYLQSLGYAATAGLTRGQASRLIDRMAKEKR